MELEIDYSYFELSLSYDIFPKTLNFLSPLKQFAGMDVNVGDGMKEVKFPQFAKHPFPSVVTFVP